MNKNEINQDLRIRTLAGLSDHKRVMLYHEAIDFIKCSVKVLETYNPQTDTEGIMYQLWGKWNGSKVRVDIFDQDDFDQYIINQM